MACLTNRSVDGTVYMAACATVYAVRDWSGGLPDGLFMYRFGRWFEMGPAACLMACLCIASVDGLIWGGTSILPNSSFNGSLVVFRQIVRIEMGLTSCPIPCSCRYGGWFDSRWARRITQHLSRVASASSSIRGALSVLPDGSLDGTLMVLQRIVWIKMDPLSCLKAYSSHFGGWFDSRRAWCIAWHLARQVPCRYSYLWFVYGSYRVKLSLGYYSPSDD